MNMKACKYIFTLFLCTYGIPYVLSEEIIEIEKIEVRCEGRSPEFPPAVYVKPSRGIKSKLIREFKKQFYESGECLKSKRWFCNEHEPVAFFQGVDQFGSKKEIAIACNFGEEEIKGVKYIGQEYTDHELCLRVHWLGNNFVFSSE